MFREIIIQAPDGQSKTVHLKGERLTLGRSSACELCFADDAGLSRQHLALEREEDGQWVVQDLGSKNGTFVNNVPLKARLRLQPGDRITAGHLVLIYESKTGAPPPSEKIVFFEGSETDNPSTSTVITSLEGALSNQTMLAETGGRSRGTAQVSALIRAGNLLAGNYPLPELFQKILDLSLEAVGAQRGVVLALERGELAVMAHQGEGFRISSAVRDRVINEKNSVLIKDAQMDEALRARMSIVQNKVRTLMAVPLQTRDQIIGLIYVDSPYMLREFTKDDLSLLTVMANTAAIRIEHARLAEVEAMERILARDLEQAADIQRQFLPSGAPRVPHADIAGYNVPCRTVGGDYYDFFPYPNGRVAMVLGDVSGKGMPASLMMMGLQARVQVLADEPEDLAASITRINKITCNHCPSNRFVTFFSAILDPATGDLLYANAGHNPPALVRAGGTIEYLQGGGPPLGILSIARYEAYRCHMDVGDVLVIYTDGVTEALNAAEQEYGEDRLSAVLQESRGLPAAAIVQAVRASVLEFSAGAPAADDVTLIVAKRTA